MSSAVNPDGSRTAMAAKLRLVQERPDWRMVMRGFARALRDGLER